jgi:hypothetical protein
MATLNYTAFVDALDEQVELNCQIADKCRNAIKHLSDEIFRIMGVPQDCISIGVMDAMQKFVPTDLANLSRDNGGAIGFYLLIDVAGKQAAKRSFPFQMNVNYSNGVFTFYVDDATVKVSESPVIANMDYTSVLERVSEKLMKDIRDLRDSTKRMKDIRDLI